MDWGKYIIVTRRGHEVPILFGPLIEHIEMGENEKIVSAGLFCVEGCDKGEIEVSVFGESVRLKIGPRIGTDDELIEKILVGQR